MRWVGEASNAKGLGVHDHLSWPFEDRIEFLSRVREFLGDGLALGLRCVYVDDRSRELLEADLAGLPDLRRHLDSGALVLDELGELYAQDAAIDPDDTLARLSAATEQALADGYAGLRVAADATPLVRTPEQLAAFATWEHTADRFMADQPFSGLCGFDRQRLPENATIALACLHPAVREGATPFRVYSPDAGADLALAGDLDASVTDDFRASLTRVRLKARRELIVDGTELEYVDHRALESIRDLAGRYDATAVLRTRLSLPERLVAMLGLEGIRAERVAAEGAHP